MAKLESHLDTRTDDYASNRSALLERIEEVRTLEAAVRGHGEKRRAKFEGRGQLIPRERVEHLLDPGSDFLELSTLAGLNMHDDKGGDGAMGGGNICGLGFVGGRRTLVTANDAAIKGGTIAPMGLEKTLRAQEIAMSERLPSVSLVESGGANLMYQSEIFVPGGRVFCNMARASAMGLPMITVVHGNATAGGAYMPGLSDYVIAVRDRAKIFLAGPPLVQAAIGEESTDEELGGAEMHATVSGLVEYVADDDAHGIALARELMSKLRWDDHRDRLLDFEPPAYDAEELLGLVPADPRHPYDAREIVSRIVDGSDFLEFKAGFGAEILCGHALIEGHPVALIGNNGPIQPDGAAKAGQFIQLCCQSGTPIIYLQNTTGYMVGKAAEQRGAIKHGAKMIQAVANATVPQITLIVGGGFGAGNYGMCGRGFDPRFIFAWPCAQVAVMGGAQAATVMQIITRAKFERQGMPLNDEMLVAMSDEIRKMLDREAAALFGTARIWDDGIIDPRDTRRVLAFTLATCREAAARTLRPNTFGVARL
jgi:geranyl-CoA carboxylase beta subunit